VWLLFHHFDSNTQQNNGWNLVNFCVIQQLRKYEDVIQLCEHTFDSAKKNSPPLHADYHVENIGPELTKDTSFMIWRCCLIFKSYFHLGRLEEDIGSLEKQVEPPSTATR
jgi:DnaJ family protein C protein 7